MSDLRLTLLLVGLVILLIIAIASYQIPKIRSSSQARRGRLNMYEDERVEQDLEGLSFPNPTPEAEHQVHDNIWEFLIGSERRELKFERKTLSADYVTSQMLRHPDQLAVDFCVTFFSEDAVSANEVLSCLQEFRVHRGRYTQIMGLIHGEDTWVDLEHCSRSLAFNDIALIHQLASVRYCVNRAESYQLRGICDQLSDQLRMVARYPFAFEEVEKRAMKLHDFCKNYNLVAQMNIRTSSELGFDGERIDRIAMECGFNAVPEGYYLYSMLGKQTNFTLKLVHAHKPWVFPLRNMDAFSTDEVMLAIPIPLVTDPVGQLREMLELSKKMAGRLGGTVVDYRQRALTEADLRHILYDTQNITNHMNSLGITPGSSLAIRLFVLT